MLYSATLLLLLLPPMGPLVQGGGGKVQEVEYDVLILKNGNRITGTLAGENETEYLIRVKGALLGVRKEHVERQTRVVLRVRETAPQSPAPSQGGGKLAQPGKPAPGSSPTRQPRHDIKLPDRDPEIAKKVFAILDRMAGENDEKREQSIQELGSTGIPGQIYLVRALLERPQMFVPILKAIEAIPESDGLYYLMLALAHLPFEVRVDAIHLLATRRYEGAAGAISEELKTDDSTVRGAAAMALATLNAESKFGAILGLFDSKDPYLLSVVSQALEMFLKNPDFAESGRIQLLERLRSSSEAVRANVAAFCGRMAIKDSLPLLVDLVSDSSEDVRAAACYALGELKDNEAVEPLKSRFALEPSSNVKTRIIDALKTIGDRSVLPFLIDLLDESDENVQEAAAKALFAITRQSYGRDRDLWVRWLQGQR